MMWYNADTGMLCPRCKQYRHRDAFVYKKKRMEICSSCRHSISSSKFLREMNRFKKSEEWKRCLEYWDYKCAVCGNSASDGYHLAPDHWQPYNLNNGVNGIENSTVVTNIVPLCHSGMIKRGHSTQLPTGCNNRKSGKLPEKWLREFLDEEATVKKLQEIETYFQEVSKNKMFESMEHQHIADLFNKAISLEEKDHKRLGGIYALKRFESAAWFSKALQVALEELPQGAFKFDETNGIQASIEDMTEVLQRYIDIIEEKTGAPAIQNEFFSARSAAWYIARKLNQRGIRITPRGIDLHLRGTEELRSTLQVGKATLFTRQQLDEYVENFDNMPKRGRPTRTPVEG